MHQWTTFLELAQTARIRACENHNYHCISSRLVTRRCSITYRIILLLSALLIASCTPRPSPNTLLTAIAGSLTASTPLATSPRLTDTPTGTATPYFITGCLDGPSSLNIRSGPGIAYDSIGYLLRGECVLLLARNSDSYWTRMERGWVYAAFLRIDGDISQLLDITTQPEAPEETPTPEPNVSTTLTPFPPELLVVRGSPRDFLLGPVDLPDAYYLPASDWMSLYDNDKILEVRGAENGNAYLEATGRLEGWFVWYKLNDPAALAPEQIGCYIVFYRSSEGARLAISSQWHPIYKDVADGKAQFDEKEFSLGDANLVYFSKERDPNGLIKINYNIEFIYHNALVVLTGHGLETRVSPGYVYEAARVVLSKLQSAPLVAP